VAVLVGAEPDFEWLAFAEAVVELALELDCRSAVTLGAYPAPVPHTRDAKLAITTSSPDLSDHMRGYVRGTLDVPAGIHAVLDQVLNSNGIPTFGLWAQVPHYVASMPYPAASCSPVGVTLRRAMGRLGEQNYNLLFNNCEHFAHWCKTGRHRSAQVESWLPAAVFSGTRLLLRQNNQLEKGKELALRSLAQLDRLRLSLQEKLEAELAKAEARWGEERFAALRLAAQRLADQLAEVEELEERLRRQFEPGEDR